MSKPIRELSKAQRQAQLRDFVRQALIFRISGLVLMALSVILWFVLKNAWLALLLLFGLYLFFISIRLIKHARQYMAKIREEEQRDE